MNTKPMLFTFINRTKWVEFGPYMSDHEARSAFQRRYGYWPENPVAVKNYK